MHKKLHIPFWINFIFCLFLLQACQKNELTTVDMDFNSFRFKETTVQKIEILSNNTVSIVVPYGTNIKSLTPDFNLLLEGSTIPKAAVVQDFSKPVYYTTISSSGAKKIFTIIVATENQPKPEITKLSVDSVYAGKKFEIQGKNFGNFGLDLKVTLISINGTETKGFNTQLIDSTKITVLTTDTLNPGLYSVKLKVRNEETISSAKIKVLFPVAEILDIPKKNVIQGNSLEIMGKYINLEKYSYQIELTGTNNYFLNPIKGTELNKLKCLVAETVLPGNYSVSVLNTTNSTKSKAYVQNINVLDSSKPYIISVITSPDSIMANKPLELKTMNFEKFNIRFYQVTLASEKVSYIMNGIFNKSSSTLHVTLPSQAAKGLYTISCSLSGENQYKYDFMTDLALQIK